MRVLHWFREDLRLSDNTALYKAAAHGEIICVFCLPKGLGAASQWWLHHSIKSVMADLDKQGVRLILSEEDPIKAVPKIVERLQIDLVTWNRVYSPAGITDGKELKALLVEQGVQAGSYNSSMLSEPTQVFNKQGAPFKVFTPFWKHCLKTLQPDLPLPTPKMRGIEGQENSESDSLDDWQLLPHSPNWAEGFDQYWKPGEKGADTKWILFTENKIDQYADGRDRPALNSTSTLSPHLVWGEIGSRQLWHQVHELMASNQISNTNGQKFLAQLGWRDYSRYLLVHFPEIETKPFNKKFETFSWADNAKLISAWQRGLTGYPIVDAGMRELWHTGYMHNRVRMVVASFLTKHLLCHWKNGADWFWDTLVDADLANNTASWQWVSGSGADAAPYFRIFNPILQGEKFDPEGEYTRKWVPELSTLEKKFLYKPWEAGDEVLRNAGVVLGENYPVPIVDHREARERALIAYQDMKTSIQ